jgi:hypothetical protein
MFGVVFSLLIGSVASAQDEVIEMFRSDLRAEKIAIITEEMDLTEEEASAFWPVYRKYERELRKINDARLELIREYGDNYFELDSATAWRMTKKSIELDIKTSYLKKEYLWKFDRVLPGTKVARFYQLENLIDLLVRLQIVSELPFVE